MVGNDPKTYHPADNCATVRNRGFFHQVMTTENALAAGLTRCGTQNCKAWVLVDDARARDSSSSSSVSSLCAKPLKRPELDVASVSGASSVSDVPSQASVLSGPYAALYSKCVARCAETFSNDTAAMEALHPHFEAARKQPKVAGIMGLADLDDDRRLELACNFIMKKFVAKYAVDAAHTKAVAKEMNEVVAQTKKQIEAAKKAQEIALDQTDSRLATLYRWRRELPSFSVCLNVVQFVLLTGAAAYIKFGASCE